MRTFLIGMECKATKKIVQFSNVGGGREEMEQKFL